MIAIVKYNAGNTRSMKNAIARLGCETIVTNDLKILKKAEKVIFPGVGEAGSAMTYLRDHGLHDVLRNLHQFEPHFEAFLESLEKRFQKPSLRKLLSLD